MFAIVIGFEFFRFKKSILFSQKLLKLKTI